MYPGKGLFMSQEQQDTPDYVRVTLTIHEFSEDGECCIVSDKHGHGTELSTDAFLHDAEDIDVGDTIACDIPVSYTHLDVYKRQHQGTD